MTTRTVKYSYRAYPGSEQKTYLNGLFGLTRVIYNTYLWEKEQAFQLKTGVLPVDLANNSALPKDLEWMGDYSNKIRQQARRDAEQAYRNFFRGLRPGQRIFGKPRFKKKRASTGSARWNGLSLTVRKLNRKWAVVRIPKGPRSHEWLKFRVSREFPSNPTGVTLKLKSNGEYWLSFTVQEVNPEVKETGPFAGVDWGPRNSSHNSLY